ncbi:MAG: hypothetical protein HYU76_11045 [Betaproteobacteria bacterium]|nr:hypothetical protein [Betaproteobacteria bacterium]
MPDKPDPGKLKGPGGMTMRELHELVKKSHARDQAGGKQHNKLAQPQSRWQRFVGEVPWVHVDLSGASCKGGLGAVGTDVTGFGVAWGIEFLKSALGVK